MNGILVAGNWKMNMTPSESKFFVAEIAEGLSQISDLKAQVLICPPFTNIASAIQSADSSIKIGAQNCYFEPKGAFTGEISPSMLKDAGCDYCIVGHSERRAYFYETDDMINKKAIALLEAGIKPVICIGETLDDRQRNKTYEVLKNQLDSCLIDITDEQAKKIVIAYEPVWAIGTGIAAEMGQIHEAHEWIRNDIYQKFGEIGKDIYILYGGIMNQDNAAEIFEIPYVNGGLIGGASLKSESFLSMIKTANKIIIK